MKDEELYLQAEAGQHYQPIQPHPSDTGNAKAISYVLIVTIPIWIIVGLLILKGCR